MQSSAISTVCVDDRALEPAQAAARQASNAECADSDRWLWDAIQRFIGWLDRTGYASYDPYDIWGTPHGLEARRRYYLGKPSGYLMTAPILAIEALWPGLRGLWVRKQRYATADAQVALAFINLHRLGRESRWLERAVRLAGDLERTSIPGYSGHCWGYPFDWQNNKGLWKRDVPYITATPYCFEVFLHLYEVTGHRRYWGLAESTSRFVELDLRDTPTGAAAAAGSYSPQDESQVVNASAYRAFVLFEAGRRFGNSRCVAKARGNLNFVLQSQRPDGSWLYGLDEPGDGFIDHFHTCFVLKNLVKINRHLQEAAIGDCIRRGWAFYRRNLFEADDTPKSFAVQPRAQLIRLDLYNLAEAITLGALLGDEIPQAYGLASRLAHRLIEEYQLRDGHFVTRVYRGGIRHTVPFLRWPQAQLFYALTNLLVAHQRPHASSPSPLPSPRPR